MRDIGSTNGIKLDGVRYEVIPLRSGTTVKIGDVSFDFSLSEEEAEALAREKPPELSPIMQEPEIAAAPKPQRASNDQSSSSGSPLAAALMFLILAAAAFFTGMAIRFQKETGGSLVQAIRMKAAAASAPVVPGMPAAK
jgi:hypothetical protein